MCRVAQKHDLELPSQLIEGTIKGAPGAAAGLLEFLYEQLTGKKYVAQQINMLALVDFCAHGVRH
jgi:hypothetical protein